MYDDSLPDNLGIRALFDPQWKQRPSVVERAAITQAASPVLNALMELDCTNTDLLRPTLASLCEVRADQFDPSRFHFIQALARTALKQRKSVARVLEQKALRALRDYLGAYVPAREQAMALVDRVASETPEAAEQIGRLFDAGDFKGVEQLAARSDAHNREEKGILADLTRELTQPGDSAEFAPKSSFEDELRQQEREFIQSVAAARAGNDGEEAQAGQNSAGELSAMRHFRESLVQRNSARRVARALEDGPENPGPLNAQALIIRSLSMMRNLSPGCASRLVSYMETLSWLEQAGAAVAPAKPRGTGRRKS